MAETAEREPLLTNAQRAYLDSFDAWLREPTPALAHQRQRALGDVCSEARVQQRRAPEQRSTSTGGTTMQTPTGAPPRPVHVILGEALREIAAREAKLERVAAELPDARAARRALAKLLPEQPRVQPARAPSRTDMGQDSAFAVAARDAARDAQTGTPLASPPSADDGEQDGGNGNGSGRRSPVDHDIADARVLATIRQHQPVARAVLLRATGLSMNQLSASIGRLREGRSIAMQGAKAGARYVLVEHTHYEDPDGKDGEQ